jgi:plasmid stabilization system protein ParE
MSKYVLLPQAQISLKEIRAYSLENFGTRQTSIYLKKLRDQMKSLAVTPSKGQDRNEIKNGYYR